jgi:hybrid cluster-associated redox disulfide protein
VIIGPDFMKKITGNTTFAEVLKYPAKKEVLVKYNFPCLGCPFAQMEIDELKLGEVCKAYKINLKSLLKELNKV